VAALKDEGKEAFGKREYVKALEAYDKALRALPEGNSDVPLMHSNKAACNMMLKRCRSLLRIPRAKLNIPCRRALPPVCALCAHAAFQAFHRPLSPSL